MRRSLPLLCLPLVLLAACSGEKGSPGEATPSAHLLPKDLPDALSVNEAMKKTPDSEVSVVGRVRVLAKGTFTLVDDSWDYCGRGSSTDDTCETPWDYCCVSKEGVAASTLVVKAQAKDGSAVAKKDLGVRPVDLVAVRGRLVKEADGSLALVAKDGWYRRERPKLPATVKFE
jgi:hypothetical protein